jgi:hypothetical protein
MADVRRYDCGESVGSPDCPVAEPGVRDPEPDPEPPPPPTVLPAPLPILFASQVHGFEIQPSVNVLHANEPPTLTTLPTTVPATLTVPFPRSTATVDPRETNQPRPFPTEHTAPISGMLQRSAWAGAGRGISATQKTTAVSMAVTPSRCTLRGTGEPPEVAQQRAKRPARLAGRAVCRRSGVRDGRLHPPVRAPLRSIPLRAHISQ